MDILKSNYISEEIIVGKLQNGLPYCIIKKKKNISKLGLLCVNFGSRDNKFVINGKVNYVKDGTAHLLEHMAFFHKRFDVMDKFNRLGANLNAYTNFTTTAYHFNTINNYYNCLNGLCDFVFTNNIEEENLELEKKIIFNEISMYHDNSQYNAFFKMLKGLIKKSSLSIEIVGDIESVSSITNEELETVFNSFYTPSNMAFIGIGNFEEAKIIETLNVNNVAKKSFGNIRRYHTNDEEKILNKIIVSNMKMDVSKQFFSFGLKLFFDKDLDLKNEISFSLILEMIFGETSDFYELLNLKGLIDFDFSFDFITFKEMGIIVLQGSTNNYEHILDEIITYLSKNENYCNDEMFNNIKKKKIGKLLQSFNDINFIATFQADLFQKNHTFHDYIGVLSTLKYCDIESCLKKIKIEENYCMSVVKK